MDFPPLSRGATDVLDRARDDARRRGIEHLEGPDVLVALLDNDEAIATLELFNDEPAVLGAALELMMRAAVPQIDGDAEQRIVDLARAEAGRLGHDGTGADHLLLALVREPGSLVGGLLSSFGMTVDTARQAMRYRHGQVDHWERPAADDAPARLATWAPMDAVPLEGIPAWVRERGDEIDGALASLEVGLKRLLRVVAIGQTVEASTIAVELIVLEVRESGAVLLWRTTSDVERLLGTPQMTIADDIDTAYSVLPMGWSGSGRESRGETVIMPRPPDAARTLVIDVRSFEDADWMTAPWPGPLAPDAVLGPWRFEVPLAD